MKFNDAPYAVGQEVAYYNAYGHHTAYHFDTVSKVTPSGIVVTANGQRFSADGHEMKTKDRQYPRSRLACVESAKASIERDKTDHRTSNEVKAIQDFIRGATNGMGQVWISEDRKAQLAAMVAALTVNA